MSESVTIQGKRMFENDAFILLWSAGLFGISYPLFTSFHVYIKHRQFSVKATGVEKRFLLSCIAEWQSMGLPMPAFRDSGLLPQFCEAVVSKPGAKWVLFFKHQTPREAVARLTHPSSGTR